MWRLKLYHSHRWTDICRKSHDAFWYLIEFLFVLQWRTMRANNHIELIAATATLPRKWTQMSISNRCTCARRWKITKTNNAWNASSIPIGCLYARQQTSLNRLLHTPFVCSSDNWMRFTGDNTTRIHCILSRLIRHFVEASDSYSAFGVDDDDDSRNFLVFENTISSD